MKRPWLLGALAVTTGLAVVGGLAIWALDPFTARQPAAGHSSSTTVTATIVRANLVSQIVLDATLGYNGTYTIGYPAANSSPTTTTDPPAAPGPSRAATSEPACASHPTTAASSATTVPGRQGHQPTHSPSCPSRPSGAGSHTPPPRGSSSGGAGPSSGGGALPADLTALPQVGQVISEGQALFAVNGTPAVLLYGSTPQWRTLTEGATGPDVAELNADLVALGDATAAQLDPASDIYRASTAAAVMKLQARLNTSQTGTLTLGQAVFEPTPLRVTSVSAALGGPVPAGGPILTATSTIRLITAAIDVSQRSALHAGDSVTIALADGKTSTGRLTSVGAVATQPGGSDSPDATPAPPTVTLTIIPTDPAATGTVDQAPVTVAITIAGVHNALAVPAAALVTTSSGHPAIDVVDAAGTARALPVTLGISEDANGLVQISGPGINAGDTITLPAQLTTR
jgi:hypothetical protein